MKKENLTFLIAGFAFGVLFGFGLFNAYDSQPALDGLAASQPGLSAPAGPMAPTQVGPGGAEGGAPMMAEINALKRRLQDNADDIEVLTRLANIYHDVAMWDQAVIYYERSAKIVTDDPNLLTDLGSSYRGVGRYDDALAMFERAQAVDSSHWQSLFNTVIVAGFDLADFDRADAAIKQMEAMQPQPPKLSDLRDALNHAREEAARTGDSS